MRECITRHLACDCRESWFTKVEYENDELRAEVERLRGLSSAWTQDLPTDAGAYWWWDGDEDCNPIHVLIEFSGFDGTYFAPQGQWGWTRFRPVSEMGGWWIKLVAPQVPAEAFAAKEGA